MNVNLHLSGELEAFVNELVKRGIAANRTDAIRLAIIKYYEDQLRMKKMVHEEPLEKSAIESHWNNPSDEKASKFYTRRYLNEKA